MIQEDLCGMKSEAISTTLVPPLFSAIKPQPKITKTLNLHIQGALERLQWTFHATSMHVSQHSIPGREPPSVALGAPTPHQRRRPTQHLGSRLICAQAIGHFSQALQHVALPNDIPTSVPISHSPSPPLAPKTQTVASIPSTPWSGTCLRADPGICRRYFDCKGK